MGRAACVLYCDARPIDRALVLFLVDGMYS